MSSAVVGDRSAEQRSIRRLIESGVLVRFRSVICVLSALLAPALVASAARADTGRFCICEHPPYAARGSNGEVDPIDRDHLTESFGGIAERLRNAE
ncbi:MAG: hypothetical protein O2905_05525 [Proteobacteria bacterium]|nr:hypothetical protein [Pseudomonadota bacterium]